MGSIVYWLTILPGGYTAWPVYCIVYGLCPAIFCLILSWINTNLKNKSLIPYISPFLWVTMEYIRGMGFMAFTWTNLGHTQYNSTALIQIASITGVCGISFLIFYVNELFREVFSINSRWFTYRCFKNKKDLLLYSVTGVILFTIYLSYGIYREKTFQPETFRRIKVAILQPNIDQEIKWDPPHGGRIIEKYFYMTREARRKNPDIILWPETAVPGLLLQNYGLTESVKNLARETGAYLLVGTLDKELNDDKIRNTVVLFTPKGEIKGKYNKMHLVPFGEFLPARSFFEKIPFIKEIVKPISRFSPGEETALFETSHMQFTVAICFESVFPEIAREGIHRGGECVIILTNDAWFKKTAAPYQHNIISVFRAVENGTFLVRCANTGVSGIIDPLGRIIIKTPIYEDRIVYGDIYPQTRKTFYTLYGDIFSELALTISIITILYTFSITIRKKKKIEIEPENKTDKKTEEEPEGKPEGEEKEDLP